MSQLFTPVRVGRYTLENRLVMAPMTRSRAAFDGTPGEWAAEYYAQRSSLGLIVSEGTQPSDDGQGYLTTPGIYTDAHVAGWKAISDRVHARGGRLFIQLMGDRPGWLARREAFDPGILRYPALPWNPPLGASERVSAESSKNLHSRFDSGRKIYIVSWSTQRSRLGR